MMSQYLYLTALSNRSITLLSSMASTITSSHNYSFVSNDEEEKKQNEYNNNKMKKGFDTIFKWSSMYSALRFGQDEVLTQT